MGSSCCQEHVLSRTDLYHRHFVGAQTILDQRTASQPPVFVSLFCWGYFADLFLENLVALSWQIFQTFILAPSLCILYTHTDTSQLHEIGYTVSLSVWVEPFSRYTQYSRVEWYSTFLVFPKLDTLLPIKNKFVLFNSKKLAMRGKVFIFKKSPGP